MEIGVASDLHRVFLMGAYFNTCLSPGDMNEMAALTNAYDANKQVVFMLADDAVGKNVVARLLLAVTSDYRLVGYNCYMSSQYADKLAYRDVLDAMVTYCARLAARCGMELSDQGSPVKIGDHFWYDDGECEWPPSAHAAWRQARLLASLQPAATMTLSHTPAGSMQNNGQPAWVLCTC
jgi:hypothetical protein